MPNITTTTKYEIKMCEECDGQMIPGLYPSNEFTKPEDGFSYIAGTIPAWVCPFCGLHMLVRKEESSDWLFANIHWQRNLTVVMNLTHELAQIHEIGTCEECDGCNDCGDLDSEEDPEEEADSEEEIPTTKDGRTLH